MVEKIAISNWRELLEILTDLPEDRLRDMPTIFDGDEREFYAISHVGFADEDVLDDGAMYLVFKNMPEEE